MAAAAKGKQKFGGLSGIAGLAKNPAAKGDGGVGAKDDIVGAAGDGRSFFAGNAGTVGAGKFAAAGGFVDIGGKDRVGDDPKLAQQFKTPGAG